MYKRSNVGEYICFQVLPFLDLKNTICKNMCFTPQKNLYKKGTIFLKRGPNDYPGILLHSDHFHILHVCWPMSCAFMREKVSA